MRKLAPVRVSYQDDFFISYRIYMMTGPFHISLFEGTLHVDKIHVWFKIANITHGLPIPVYRRTDFTPKRMVISRLQDTVVRFRTGVKFSPRYKNGGGGVNSRRGDSRWHDILWWYHVNKYRAMRGNQSEIALGWKSLCTLYVNCFILSFASNRQEMVPACFVVGVVKHWMQTDWHVHDCILG